LLSYSVYKNKSSIKWVTFIHGAGGSSSIWFRQIRAFKKEFNVLLIDLSGHGKSKSRFKEQSKQGYTFDLITKDIKDVLTHLNVKSSHFIGVSLGSIIVRDLAENHPKLVESLVLAGAILKFNIRSNFLMRFGNFFRSLVPYIMLYKLFAFIIMPKKNHKESRSLLVEECKKLYQKEFKRWFTLVSEVNPLLALFRIKDSGIPTLYVMGEEDHMFLPSITKLVRNHVSSTLYIIPECGHVVNVERPQIFNRQVINYLRCIS